MTEVTQLFYGTLMVYDIARIDSLGKVLLLKCLNRSYVKKSKIQVLACAAMYIACTWFMSGGRPVPDMEDYMRVSARAFTQDQMEAAVIEVLDAAKWQLLSSTPFDVLQSELIKHQNVEAGTHILSSELTDHIGLTAKEDTDHYKKLLALLAQHESGADEQELDYDEEEIRDLTVLLYIKASNTRLFASDGMPLKCIEEARGPSHPELRHLILRSKTPLKLDKYAQGLWRRYLDRQ